MKDSARVGVQKYLDGLVWDGGPRYLALAQLTGSTENAPALRAFLLSAVRRAYEPGCRVDRSLVLTGPQGVGKTAFLRSLGGDFYDDVSWSGCDDMARIMAGGDAWILGLHEFESADQETLKVFLSATGDLYHQPVSKVMSEAPRSSVVVLSTSGAVPQGERRLDGVELREPVTVVTERLRDQLWAQAVFYYKSERKKP